MSDFGASNFIINEDAAVKVTLAFTACEYPFHWAGSKF
jgi:hypothetical protein